MFAYEDSVVPELIDPVLEANPDLKIETATFDSNEEAAAKLAGGFEADVVEVCLDEMDPLLDQDLLRPLDPTGITSWDDLEFTDAEGIVRRRRDLRRPALGRPRGPRLQHRGGAGGDRRDRRPLRPAVRRALDDPRLLRAAGDRRGRARARDRGPDEPDSEQLEQAKKYLIDNRDQFRTLWGSDSDLVNLFKSGEVVVAAAGPQLAQRIIDAGVPAKWAPAEGGHALLGLRLRDHLEGAEHPTPPTR